MPKLIAAFFLCISLTTSAQDKLLTMEDAMVKYRTTLAAENLRQLQFIYGTNDYVYLKKADGKDVWVSGSLVKPETNFLTLEQLNEKLKAAGYADQKAMPAIRFNNSPYWILTVDGSKISLDPKMNTAKLLLGKSLADKENAEESNAGYVAYLDDFNLYVAKGSEVNKVTSDGSKDIVYASSVHREEFGISKGTFWSNNGNVLAFYRMDQSMVTDYPIIDWTKRPAVNGNIKYPMAGDKSHQVTVGIYNAVTKTTVYLKTGEPAEQYLTNIAWSPDDKYIYIAVVNRQQNHMQLKKFDAATGELVKIVFEEKDDKYVEPLVPMLFVKNRPDQFIWQSRRDGWNHLYLYDANSGNLVKQLTKGNWEVLEVKDFDSKGENVYISATQESPVTKNLYQLTLKTGALKRLTAASAAHAAQVSTDGSFIIDSYTNLATARTLQLTELKTGKTKVLLQAADPVKEYAKGDLSVFTIKNRDGDSIYCRLFKPVNFDPAKKYPVIVYWYGGPHAQMILNAWNGGAGDYWFQYMAERGYVVFSIDPRGSSNRGKAFEQAIFRRAGAMQMQDLEDGLAYLTGQSYVDKNNMGLFGWSYGGFMTTDFVLNHPGVFKAAVAGGPVMDWQMYEIMYGERYMDTPQENPEGYEATNLIKQAGKLKDKLLLIHGLQDPVVVQEHSVNFVRACIDKGVQVDYMIYPGHEHNVIGKDRAHLYQKVTDYFMQYLKQ